MNKQTFETLYGAALPRSTDVNSAEFGRSALAWQIISDNADFLEQHYPDYSRSSAITRIDDLTKILTGEADDDSYAAVILAEEYGGDVTDPSILEDLIDCEVEAYRIAYEESIKSPPDEKEIPILDSDVVRHVCGLESTLTDVTSELRGLGFPLLAGRVEDELGDLQDTIVNCGLELGQY